MSSIPSVSATSPSSREANSRASQCLSVPIELRRLRVHEDKLVEREQGEANIVILEVQPVQPATKPALFQSVEDARPIAFEANRATAV